MAISARFSADFSSFNDAVQKAEIELRGFEGAAGKVESALSRMTDNFSGRKIITDATLMAQAVENVGGVTKLTAAELAKVGASAQEAAAKFRAWGQEVPPKIQAIADSVSTAAASVMRRKGMGHSDRVRGARPATRVPCSARKSASIR